jgi:hypothetical protein
MDTQPTEPTTPDPSPAEVAGALSSLEPTVAPAELDAHAAVIQKLTDVNEELRLLSVGYLARAEKAEAAVRTLKGAMNDLRRAFGGERLHPDQRARLQQKAWDTVAKC